MKMFVIFIALVVVLYAFYVACNYIGMANSYVEKLEEKVDKLTKENQVLREELGKE